VVQLIGYPQRVKTRSRSTFFANGMGISSRRSWNEWREKPLKRMWISFTATRTIWSMRSLGESFIYFLAVHYIQAMSTFGYLGTTPDQLYPVRSDTKNLGLYYLAFFSKSDLGRKLWKDVLHYSSEQLGFAI